jgi:hypothetical protein
MATDDVPRTVDEAVRLLLGLVPDAEQIKIAAMTDNDLVNLHFGLGIWIRNNLCLWDTNSALLVATGESHPDDASGVIVRALWQRLRDDLPKVH